MFGDRRLELGVVPDEERARGLRNCEEFEDDEVNRSCRGGGNRYFLAGLHSTRSKQVYLSLRH